MSTDKMALLFQPTGFFSKTVSIFAYSNNFRRVCIFAKKKPITLVTSVHLSVSITASPTGRISVKFDIGDSHEICQPYPNLVKIGHFTWLSNEFSYSSDINSPYKRCLQVIWCQAVRIAEEL